MKRGFKILTGKRDYFKKSNFIQVVYGGSSFTGG